jgi:hypothetical protein
MPSLDTQYGQDASDGPPCASGSDTCRRDFERLFASCVDHPRGGRASRLPCSLSAASREFPPRLGLSMPPLGLFLLA